MTRETWYVLEGGGVADPRDIITGAGDMLRHRDGRAVEYRPHGPRSRGVDEAEMTAYRETQAEADAKSRAAAEASAKSKVNAGEITPNEVRAEAGLPPAEPAKAVSPADRQVTPGNGKNKVRS